MISFKKTEKIQSSEEIDQQIERLGDNVKRLLKNYFRQLGGENPKNVYGMVLPEVEIPLPDFFNATY
jgi:DNA-binding protein Fis